MFCTGAYHAIVKVCVVLGTLRKGGGGEPGFKVWILRFVIWLDILS